MDVNVAMRRISKKVRPERFAVGRCCDCGGLNHRAVDCVERKMALRFKHAEVEAKQVGTKEGFKETGNKIVN